MKTSIKMIKRFSVSAVLITFSVLISAVLIVSCRTAGPVTDSKDLSYLYNPTRNAFTPLYNVQNQSEKGSILSVKFYSADMFFSQANPQGIPTAMILITVKLFNTTQGRVLTDTAYFNLSIVKEEQKKEYVYNIPLKVEPGQEYNAEVRILDRIRLQVVQSFVSFSTSSDKNRFNFLARGHSDKNHLFNPTLRYNDYVNLVYLKGPVDSIYIAYYKPFKELPHPPSMMLPARTIDYGPEQVIALPYSDTLPMMFPNEGIYMCSVDSTASEGFTFFNFGLSYPQMTTPEQMMEPLGYLASADELNTLKNAERPKLALDDFWIKCGGNVEKARELIRIYYTRVLYANFYFTSFTEGWRTERGMIYIMYGPPDKVYKSNDGETWGYRKPEIKSSWGTRYTVQEEYLYFVFRKKESRFTDNDYYLSRSESMVTYWDLAVNNWRKGIVFRLDNPEGI
jgi:GWxTD domain-containing protein